MVASYPGAVKSFTDVTDNVSEIVANDINPVYAEIVAIEAELGTDVAGTVATLKLRLAQSLSGAGNLDFETSTELTIASGAIVPTQNWHLVDTEGDAASDDLTTITATNATDGFLLFLRQANDARDITVKHGTGNILCPGGVDIILADTTQMVALLYDATLEKWIVFNSVVNAALLTKVNTYSAENIFTKSMRHAYTSVSSNTTLDATHEIVSVDASGGARTITLPTAVGINGRCYTIRKLDSSGNAVTINGDGAETINGSATKVLAAQYDFAEVCSNGTNWDVIR
jgi:hypothetical protein